VIVDLDGTVATPADYLRIDALLAALDHADPYNRHRWPAR
jgi:hypothetical protein